MALVYKITTRERVILSVDAEGFSYYLWLRCETPSKDVQGMCQQMERFLFSLGLVYSVLNWEVVEID